MKKHLKGFSYKYAQEKYNEYKKISTEHKLEWLEKMNRFFYYFRSPKDRKIWERIRKGEI